MLILGQLARQVYESMRREAACLRIQRDLRMYFARQAYKEFCSSAVSIQTGMRGMVARNELRFRRQTRAAIIIQVKQSFWQNSLLILKILSSFFFLNLNFNGILTVWKEYL